MPLESHCGSRVDESAPCPERMKPVNAIVGGMDDSISVSGDGRVFGKTAFGNGGLFCHVNGTLPSAQVVERNDFDVGTLRQPIGQLMQDRDECLVRLAVRKIFPPTRCQLSNNDIARSRSTGFCDIPDFGRCRWKIISCRCWISDARCCAAADLRIQGHEN